RPTLFPYTTLFRSAQRLVMGKGFFARHKHPLHWCVQQIVNGIRCRVTCSQRCRCPLHQTIQRSVTARLCTLWCSCQNAAGRFHGHTGGFGQHACLFFASVSLLTVEDPHNATVFCRNRCGDLRVHVRLRSAGVLALRRLHHASNVSLRS